MLSHLRKGQERGKGEQEHVDQSWPSWCQCWSKGGLLYLTQAVSGADKGLSDWHIGKRSLQFPISSASRLQWVQTKVTDSIFSVTSFPVNRNLLCHHTAPRKRLIWTIILFCRLFTYWTRDMFYPWYAPFICFRHIDSLNGVVLNQKLNLSPFAAYTLSLV